MMTDKLKRKAKASCSERTDVSGGKKLFLLKKNLSERAEEKAQWLKPCKARVRTGTQFP